MRDLYRDMKDPYNTNDPYRVSRDPYRDPKDPYKDSKDHYLPSRDSYRDQKELYPGIERSRGPKTNTERYKEEERIREHQRLTWRDPREAYDSSRQHHDQFLPPGYGPDDRHLNYPDGSYDTHGRPIYDNNGYRNHQNNSMDTHEYQEKQPPQKKPQSGNWYEFELSKNDKRHRSRPPPQQLNLEGRNVPASPPSGGRRDDMRSRDRKVRYM